MASPTGRFLSSGSQVLLYAVAVVVALVALFSFALSFSALAELAVASNVPHQIAWAWPVVVDLSIIVGTFASLVLRGRTSRAVRAYPWAILIFFGLVSILGNGYHALTGGAAATPAVAFAVGAVPAIALLASTHLLVVMLTSAAVLVTDEQIIRDVKKAERVLPVAPRASKVTPRKRRTPAIIPSNVVEVAAHAPTSAGSVADAVSEPVQATKTPAVKPSTRAAQGRPGSMTREQAARRVLSHYAESGSWLSGPEVGALMGVTRKTGSRVVSEVRVAQEAA